MEPARLKATTFRSMYSVRPKRCGSGESIPGFQASESGDPVPMVGQISSLLPLLPFEALLAIKGFIDDARHRGHTEQTPSSPRLSLTITELALLWYFRQLPHEECRIAAVEVIQEYVSVRDRDALA